MTDKFTHWLQSVAQRDQTLITLTIMTAAIVLAWALLDLWPPRYAVWMRRLYLLAGLPLYLATLLLPVLQHWLGS